MKKQWIVVYQHAFQRYNSRRLSKEEALGLLCFKDAVYAEKVEGWFKRKIYANGFKN